MSQPRNIFSENDTVNNDVLSADDIFLASQLSVDDAALVSFDDAALAQINIVDDQLPASENLKDAAVFQETLADLQEKINALRAIKNTLNANKIAQLDQQLNNVAVDEDKKKLIELIDSRAISYQKKIEAELKTLFAFTQEGLKHADVVASLNKLNALNQQLTANHQAEVNIIAKQIQFYLKNPELFNRVKCEQDKYPDLIYFKESNTGNHVIDETQLTVEKVISAINVDIRLLLIRMDAKKDIAGDSVTINNQEIYLRFANKADLVNAEKEHSFDFNYAHIAFAYVLTAVNLSEMYGFDKNDVKQKQFLVAIYEFKKKIFNDIFMNVFRKAEMKFYEKYLIRCKAELSVLLKQYAPAHLNDNKEFASLESIGGMLDAGVKWSTLNQPSTSLATVITTRERQNDHDESSKDNNDSTVSPVAVHPANQNADLILLDIPLTRLTLAQQASLQTDIHKEKKHDYDEPFNEKIYHYFSKKFPGNVIPSQLKTVSDVKINKNAYQTDVLTVDDNGKVKFLNNYMHSATPAHLDNDIKKNTKQDEKNNPSESVINPDAMITQENLRQLKLNSDKDAVFYFTLNSEHGDKWLKRFGGKGPFEDSSIVLLMRKAGVEFSKEKENIFVDKMCLNSARIGFGPIGLNEAAEEAKSPERLKFREFIDNNIAAIKDFSKQRSGLKNIIAAEIDSLETDLNRLEKLQNRFSFPDLQVKGTKIIYLMTKIAHRNNQLIEQLREKFPQEALLKDQLKTLEVGFSCASGNNRTGTQELVNLMRTVASGTGNRLHDERGKEAACAIVNSYHVQQLVAMGTIPGLAFVRSKSKGSLPSKLKATEENFFKPYGDIKNIKSLEDKHKKHAKKVTPSADVRVRLYHLRNKVDELNRIAEPLQENLTSEEQQKILKELTPKEQATIGKFTPTQKKMLTQFATAMTGLRDVLETDIQKGISQEVKESKRKLHKTHYPIIIDHFTELTNLVLDNKVDLSCLTALNDNTMSNMAKFDATQQAARTRVYAPTGGIDPDKVHVFNPDFFAGSMLESISRQVKNVDRDQAVKSVAQDQIVKNIGRDQEAGNIAHEQIKLDASLTQLNEKLVKHRPFIDRVSMKLRDAMNAVVDVVLNLFDVNNLLLACTPWAAQLPIEEINHSSPSQSSLKNSFCFFDKGKLGEKVSIKLVDKLNKTASPAA